MRYAKSATIAVALNALPWLGHVYLGRKARAAGYGIACVAGLALQRLLPDAGHLAWMVLVAAVAASWLDLLVSLRTLADGPQAFKDPDLALALSLLLPGLGQLYNGHGLKAVLCLVTGPGMLLMAWKSWPALGAWMLIAYGLLGCLFAMADAVISAMDQNEESAI